MTPPSKHKYTVYCWDDKFNAWFTYSFHEFLDDAYFIAQSLKDTYGYEFKVMEVLGGEEMPVVRDNG